MPVSKPNKYESTAGTKITYKINIPIGYVESNMDYSFTVDVS
jgi:hypothetical protein